MHATLSFRFSTLITISITYLMSAARNAIRTPARLLHLILRIVVTLGYHVLSYDNCYVTNINNILY